MLKTAFLFLVLGAAALSSSLAVTAAVDSPGALPVLLGLDPVRADLKLNSLQRAVLDSLRAEYKSAARKLVDPMPATMEQRVAAEKQLLQINARYNKRAISVLDKGQRARLREIEHQVNGATMIYAPSVQKSLGVSGKQKEAIEALRKKGAQFVGRVNRQFEDGLISSHERIALLRDRRLSQATAILKVLTPEQRDAFWVLGGRKIVS